MPTTEYGVDAFFQNAGTSPKMVYDAAGTLGWSPHNTALQSQTFDNAAWTKPLGVVSANAVAAPDGTTTADAWIPNNGVVDNYLSGTLAATNGAVNTISIYAKNGTLGNNWLQVLFLGNNEAKWFNLATGVVGSGVIGTPVSSSITNVGNGWYRLTMSITAIAASGTVYLAPRSTDGDGSAITGNGTSPAFYLWGAQMNRGAAPTAYLPTTTAARVGLALDYDPVTHAAKGLLCEPQATNVVAPSTPPSATSGVWFIRGSSTLTQGQSDPTGGLNAVLAAGIMDIGTAEFFASTTGLAASARCEPSFFLKKVSPSGTLRVIDPVGGNGRWDINLALLGSGWARITRSHAAVTITTEFLSASGGEGGIWFLQPGAVTPISFYLYGVQLETGTVATSHIPTLAATVTRAVDNYKATAASIGYSATAGSWWAEHYTLAGQIGGWIIGQNLGGHVPIYHNGDDYYAMESGGSPLYNITGAGVTGNINRVACAFQSGDRALAARGLAATVDAGLTAGLLSPTDIWFGWSPSGTHLTGYIRKVRYLPRRPSNAELQAMAT